MIKIYHPNGDVECITDIDTINPEKANQLIKTREPKGKFYFRHTKYPYNWIAIDNSTGDAWTEEFKNFHIMLRWLRGERNDETIPDEPDEFEKIKKWHQTFFVEQCRVSETRSNVEWMIQEIENLQGQVERYKGEVEELRDELEG